MIILLCYCLYIIAQIFSVSIILTKAIAAQTSLLAVDFSHYSGKVLKRFVKLCYAN